MKKLLVAVVGVALLAMQAGVSAWGMDVHRLITRVDFVGLAVCVSADNAG